MVQHTRDVEFFKAEIQLFLYSYSLSPWSLSRRLAQGNPSRLYYYLNGKHIPQLNTRRRWRKFMRHYRATHPIPGPLPRYPLKDYSPYRVADSIRRARNRRLQRQREAALTHCAE